MVTQSHSKINFSPSVNKIKVSEKILEKAKKDKKNKKKVYLRNHNNRKDSLIIATAVLENNAI